LVAVQIEKQEGLEAIQQKEVPVPTVQAGEVLMSVAALLELLQRLQLF
jgi:NADPH:quinone reductase-like Zn-dependent oxidoreductase